jgi:amino acid transporter
MHWMSTTDPPQLKDKSKRTHIFDWKVPITVGGSPGAIAGTLTWVPLDSGGSVPLGAIWALAGLLILLCIVLVMVRRRRATDAPGAAEAW